MNEEMRQYLDQAFQKQHERINEMLIGFSKTIIEELDRVRIDLDNRMEAGFTDLHQQINNMKSEQRYMKVKMFDFERALDEREKGD
ncbi:hypothetical protein LLE49_09060 [Alicyclobacillus tolerans]|uniref:hypothetical protein n=1 Tax=Alicyclobacillus tolerans TaxID=90970 RepID=UPI001F358F9C|nr:hypothetical protein [Alicyclobacillus tolerans]MCF8564866.1 hypothetical protein [Alicyclobacillus tolerans]